MDELYQLFLQISGGQSGPEASRMGFALADVIAQLGITPEAAAPTAVPVKKSTQSTSEKSESAFSKVLKNAFGVAPLIGGLIELFSGSDDPPPLLKYALPPSVHFEAAQTRDGLTSMDYDQSGRPRAYPVSQPATRENAAATPQITVNVQAMDARSFLDRSGDIAMAVRDAMLNLNSINDVVNDL